MAFGDYKKKRKKLGRPKELESIMRKLDQALVTTIDRVQEDLPIAYQAIHDVLVATDSSPTNKFSAAKWIVEYSEKSFAALMQQLEDEMQAEAATDSEDEEEPTYTFKVGSTQSDNKTFN